MSSKTNELRSTRGPANELDATDRKLLGILCVDAGQSYAELGMAVHLSGPAVHERVKRLKRDGVIRGVVARIDPAMAGRPLLAFIQIQTSSWDTTRQIVELSELPDVEEIHTVAGDSAMMLKVRTRDPQALESLLGQIHRMEGFGSAKSYIALSTYLERGPMPA